MQFFIFLLVYKENGKLSKFLKLILRTQEKSSALKECGGLQSTALKECGELRSSALKECGGLQSTALKECGELTSQILYVDPPHSRREEDQHKITNISSKTNLILKPF